jgi:hypothetical protein
MAKLTHSRILPTNVSCTPEPVVQLGTCEVPLLAHCSNSSCEITFAKAAGRHRPFFGQFNFEYSL